MSKAALTISFNPHLFRTEKQSANLNLGYNQERIFIKYCLLEKADYELGYKLNSRPKWAVIPIEGISNIIIH